MHTKTRTLLIILMMYVRFMGPFVLDGKRLQPARRLGFVKFLQSVGLTILGAAIIVAGLAAMVAIFYYVVPGCFQCSKLVELALILGGGGLMLGGFMIYAAWADVRWLSQEKVNPAQLTRETPTQEELTPEKIEAAKKILNAMQNARAQKDKKIRESLPFSPHKKADFFSNVKEKAFEVKNTVKGLAEDYLRDFWNQNEDREVDAEITNDPLPASPVEMEESRRRNMILDFVRDTINNKNLYLKDKKNPGLNAPGQFGVIMAARAISHHNHMKRIIYLTLGQIYKQKSYDQSLGKIIIDNESQFDTIFKKIKDWKTMKPEDRKSVFEEVGELIRTLKEKAAADKLKAVQNEVEKQKILQGQVDEAQIEENVMAQKLIENRVTPRDLRTPLFRGLVKTCIRIYALFQRTRLKLLNKKLEALNQKAEAPTEAKEILKDQESKLNQLEKEISKLPGEEVEVKL